MAWIAEAAAGDDAAYDARESPELAGSRALLTSRPAGFYTCARLVAGTPSRPQDALVVWPFHLERLASALRSRGGEAVQVSAMQRKTNDMVQRVAALARSDAKAQGDLMVTVLWWKSPEDKDMISVHMSPMPQPKLEGATAFVYGSGRENAAFKHSQWVADRVPIEQRAREVEKKTGSTFQEVILSSPALSDAGETDRALLEGSVSNFYVVRNGAVVTAQTNVLHGSTREIVLTACGDLGIPVSFEPPRLSECATWDAAFVTSAVRLVMEIETLVWESQDPSTPSLCQASFPRGKCDIPRRIRDHILAQRLYLPSA